MLMSKPSFAPTEASAPSRVRVPSNVQTFVCPNWGLSTFKYPGTFLCPHVCLVQLRLVRNLTLSFFTRRFLNCFFSEDFGFGKPHEHGEHHQRHGRERRGGRRVGAAVAGGSSCRLCVFVCACVRFLVASYGQSRCRLDVVHEGGRLLAMASWGIYVGLLS